MIYLGADHAGFKMKEVVKRHLQAKGIACEDCGAQQENIGDDYPQYGAAVARKVVADEGSQGILFCASGAGICVAANKIKGARCAQVWNTSTAKHAVEDNHAQIISLASDEMDIRAAITAVNGFLTAKPDDDERHLRRIGQIGKIENHTP